LAERIQPGESGIETARRIVRSQAKKALKDLTVRGPAPDVAIHEARKRIKRARAALRLIREPLGDRRFRRENEALRDAGRPLSQARDAKILVESLDSLSNDAQHANRAAIRLVRQSLIAHQLRVRRRLLGKKEALKPVMEELRSARRRASRWSNGSADWSELGEGIRRVYRAGRKGFASARRDPSDERLHEWRKQTKYLRHQLEMLEPMAPPQLRTWAQQAHRLSDCLGNDHDLAVLSDRLRHPQTRVPASAVRDVSRLIARKRRMLQPKAMALGKGVYRLRARLFVNRLERQWRAWRRRMA
jgi:CHAD domain-containing protein